MKFNHIISATLLTLISFSATAIVSAQSLPPRPPKKPATGSLQAEAIKKKITGKQTSVAASNPSTPVIGEGVAVPSMPDNTDPITSIDTEALTESGLRLMKKGQIFEALENLEKAAGLGNSTAMVELGKFYRDDSRMGNPAKAFSYFKQAAEKLNPYGMAYLGQCYSKGTGTAINTQLAYYWNQYATDMDNELGFVTLGNCYYNGVGVKQDFQHAVVLFKRAAERGVPVAYKNLGICYEDGLGVKKDLSQALTYYTAAKELGLDVDAEIAQIQQQLFPKRSISQPDRSEIVTSNEPVVYNDEQFAELEQQIKDSIESGDFNESRRLLHKYIEIINDFDIDIDDYFTAEDFILAGDKLLELGDTEEARKWYEKAAGMGSKDAEKRLKALEPAK